MRRTVTAAALAVASTVGLDPLTLTPLPAMAQGIDQEIGQEIGQEIDQEGSKDSAFAVPDCAALLAWASGLDRKQPYHLTPAAKVQNVFEPGRSERVFGVPAVHWTAEQAGALVVAKKSCAQGFQKAKRPADTRALNAVNVRALDKSLKAIATHRETVARLIDALGAEPAGPELRQTLAAMTPPRYRPGPALKQVADAESRKRVQTLARSLAQIPEDEASAALGAFAGEQASLARDRLGTLREQADAAPASVDGLFQIAGLRLDARALAAPGTPTLAEHEAAADARAARILETIGAARTAAPIALPACAPLARWAAGVDLRAVERFGAEPIYAFMRDGALVPVFDKPLEHWTAADFELLTRLREICSAQATLSSRDAALARDMRAARRKLGDAARILERGQGAYVAYLEVYRTLNGQRAELASLPAAPESLARLDAMLAEPALARLTPAERQGHQQAIRAKRQAITLTLRRQQAGALLEQIARLPATPDGLAALDGAGSRLRSLATSPAEGSLYGRAIDEQRARIATAILDDAAAKLAHAEASIDGLREVQAEYHGVSRLLASGGAPAEAARAFGAAYEAALARVAGAALADHAAFLAALPEDETGLAALERSRREVLGDAGATALALEPYAQAIAARRTAIQAALTRARLDEAGRRVAQIPATAEGLAQLAGAHEEIASWDLDDEARGRLVALIAERRRAIATELLAEPIAGLDRFDGTLESLAALPGYSLEVTERYGRRLGREALGPFLDALDHKRETVAAAALPAWQDALAELPGEPQSLETIETRLTAFGALGQDPAPALEPYVEAGKTRAVEIIEETSMVECRPTWSATGMGEDVARLDVLTHDGTTRLALLACALADAGATLGRYEGAATDAARHVLELTTRDGVFVTVTLREGRIGPERSALIGLSVADANVERTLSVADWKDWLLAQVYTQAERERMAREAACAELAARPESELGVQHIATVAACVGGAIGRGLRD